MPSSGRTLVPDVAVVGGGVIGLSIAWRAAQSGLSVELHDPEPATGGATHAAAGMLAPVGEVHFGEEPLLALALASARRWPSFVAGVEQASRASVGYRTEGALAVAFDDDDLRVLDDLHGFQCSLGLDARRLRTRELRGLEPSLSPRIRGGLQIPGDHQVDGRALAVALLVAAERAGVRIVRQGIESVAGLAADRVVVAAGCWSAVLGGLPGAPPVRPVKGQILRLRFDPADPPLTRIVRALADGRSVYLVPRASGELVVGATVEEQGFDTTVTAGAVHDLLRAAIDVVPEVAELEVVEALARLRPGTPDNAPILGPVPGDERVVLATGHYRNGILLAPVTADAIVELLTTGSVPALAAPFAPSRFGR